MENQAEGPHWPKGGRRRPLFTAFGFASTRERQLAGSQMSDAQPPPTAGPIEYLVNLAESITGLDLDNDGDVGVAGQAEEERKPMILRLRDGRAVRLTEEQEQRIDRLREELRGRGYPVEYPGWDENRTGELLYGFMWNHEMALNGALLLSLPDSATAAPEDPRLAECFRKLKRTESSCGIP